MKRLLSSLPGLGFAFLVSISSQLVGSFFPTIGASLFAILLGLLVGNSSLYQTKFRPGVRFAEKRLLEIAIVLNGLSLSNQVLGNVGWNGLVFLLFQMSMTFLAAHWIGKWLGFSSTFSLLMGVGNAVCGTAAIGTIAPIVEAKSKEKGMSITAVNLVGIVFMLGLPAVAAVLYDSAVTPTATLIGGVIQSVGQVVGSAKIIGDDVLQLATIIKLIRVLSLSFIALLVAGTQRKEYQNSSKRISIPWFIVGFLLLYVLKRTGIIPTVFVESIDEVRTQLELLALSAIGMNSNLKDFVQEGPKTLLYASLIGIVQLISALLLISFLF